MKEVLLRLFFEGEASAEELAADLVGTRRQDEPPGFRSSAHYAVEPMARQFGVGPDHLERLIEAVLAGTLTREDLGTIVFCMEAAPERWLWDVDDPIGARVADAVFWLGTPEVNYPLTEAVLEKIRVYLKTGEKTLGPTDLSGGAVESA